MPFDSYASLKTSIATTIDRSDLDVAVIPDWVSLAEAEISRHVAQNADRLTPLSADTDTNWVLENHPDAYLYGSLVHSAPFLVEDERIAIWQGLFSNALSRIEETTGDWDTALESVGTYTGLVQIIGKLLNRQSLNAVIPTWIEMCEADISRRYRRQMAADLPALQVSETNWFLTAHPDVYLYGSLVHSMPYMPGDERLPVWSDLYNKALANVSRVGGEWTTAEAEITDYDGLQSLISKLLDRADLDGYIPAWIKLSESAMSRSLEVRLMDEYVQFNPINGQSALPSNFSKLTNIEISGTEQIMTYVSPSYLDGMFEYSDTAQLYTIQGDQIIFYPCPSDDTIFEMRYRSRIEALSDTNTTNWLLEKHPDAYLYGALVHSAPYLGDDPRLGTWGGLYGGIIQSINQNDIRESTGSFLQSRSGYGNYY